VYSRTARNSIALLISQAVTALVTALMLPLLTRYLGRAGYGLYTSIYAFVGTFGILGDIGLNVILNREIARKREQGPRLLGQTLVLKTLLLFLFLAVTTTAAIPRSFGPSKWLLLSICALESGSRTYANTMIATLRAYEIMGYETIITLLDRACWVVGILLVVWLDLGLVFVFLVFLFAAIVRLISAFAICWTRVSRPRPGVDLRLWRFMLREAWPIGSSLGAQRVYDRVGIVQLSAVSDPATVGLFSGPSRVYQLTNALASSVPDALFPSLAAAARVSKDRLQWITISGLKALLLATLPLAGFYVMFASYFTPWLLGGEFGEAALALQVLAPAVVLAAVNALLRALLRASGRQRYDLLCTSGALATNFFLNLLLIPRLSYVGPAVAVLVSQGIQSGLALAGTLPLLGRLPARHLFIPLLATLTMLGAWWLAGSLPLLLRLPMGLIVYGIALFLLGGIDHSTVQLTKTIFDKHSASGETGARENVA